MPALKEFEKITGVGYQNMDPASMTHLNAMLFAAIKYGLPRGSRSPTFDEVGEMMTDMDFPSVSDELANCLMNSIPSFRRMTEAKKKPST